MAGRAWFKTWDQCSVKGHESRGTLSGGNVVHPLPGLELLNRQAEIDLEGLS